MAKRDKPAMYGHYAIVERYQVPGESVEFVLAHGSEEVQPWAVGGGVRQGDYFHSEKAARVEFARRVAESLDLIVAPDGAVAVLPQERKELTDLARSYQEAAAAFEGSEHDCDENDMAVDMRTAADAVTIRLQELGIIAGVYETWEMNTAPRAR
ncbi:hypothetical protein [Streptomyces sp. NPDC127098]|uniref:hypothetical protein n=1 Tax=Streptomyces sp. NPDC127098 TaxID=3347137 RepID=UPI003668FA55